MAEDDYDWPSDQDIEDSYASTWLSFQNELGRERFRYWLAAHDVRVAREALDGLAADALRTASNEDVQRDDTWADDARLVARSATEYRDLNFPEVAR